MQFRQNLDAIKRIVIKVGSAVITKDNGHFEQRQIRILVEDICQLIDHEIEVILVSSGAVNIGKKFLKKLKNKEHTIEYPQAAAAIGQPQLMGKYSALFSENNRECAQILLTQDDFRQRKRFLNAKKTIDTLLQHQITPILNENDSVAFSKVTLGDNDHLAASAAQMLGADLLLIITSSDGLYDRNPEEKGAIQIKFVAFGEMLSNVDMNSKTSSGRGGMRSKVEALSKILPLGIPAVLSSKCASHLILDPLTQNIGTFFAARTDFDPELRKAWLISTKKSGSKILVDRGAQQALLAGKSLLPSGIIGVKGDFYRGDCVEIVFDSCIIALGVTNYHFDEILDIKGLHSNKIVACLGYTSADEVVHADNIVRLK